MKEFVAMKTVYSYFLPEVRPLVAEVDRIPKGKLFLTQTSPEEAQALLAPLNLHPMLEIPATERGKLDLDMLHEPIIDSIVRAYSASIPHLADYLSRYPTNGSSEGIFHKLNQIRNTGYSKIYILDGEYEGYQEYGKTLGIETEVVQPETNPRSLQPGFWFISNPSARDGNIIPNEFIKSICEAGHRLALDLTYVGTTKPYTFDVEHENIETVFLSFSKPYGLFRSRIGFTFDRQEIPSLYANKWFKNISNLLIALNVAQKIGPESLHQKYGPVQLAILDQINKDFALGIRPSDVYLLGYLPQEAADSLDRDLKALISQFKRGGGFRFCLTPYFEKREAGIV